MTVARLPSETAVDRTDPLDRPPEIASALAGAELALPYLLESDDVASFARIAAAGVPRARVSPPMLPLLVAVSADALVERIAPVDRRPEVVELDLGAEPGFDAVVELLAAAGYERVDTVEERGG